MSESVEGTLHVKRVQRRTGRLLEDALFPRYYKQMSAYVIDHEEEPNEVLVGLRGKVLSELTPEDTGRRVRVYGTFRWNPRVGPNRRLGVVTRVRLEDVAAVSTTPTPSDD